MQKVDIAMVSGGGQLHSRLFFNHKRFGFTLAEVLITLAIIGIVVSLTLPSIINKYQKQESCIRLKRAYNLLNQSFYQQLQNTVILMSGRIGNILKRLYEII